MIKLNVLCLFTRNARVHVLGIDIDVEMNSV
jgi:hypothetical protein